MSVLTFHPPDRGPRCRPPCLRVFTASAAGNRSDAPAWSSDRHEPSLQPLQMRWATNGQLTTLTLKYVLGRGPGRGTAEHPENVLGVRKGDRVMLCESAPGSAGQQEWFRGYIAQEEILIQSHDDLEALTFTAYGPEIRLQAKVVSGQWHKTPAADDKEIAGQLGAAERVLANTFFSHLRVVFNENGKPNASGSFWKLTDKDEQDGGYPAGDADCGCKVFEAPGRKVINAAGQTVIQAQYWTAYDALRSIIEYFDDYEVISYRDTNWPAIRALLGQTPIGEVNVEGMTLLEAMKAILLPVGFAFAIAPWSSPDARGEPRHRLLVFSLHRDASDHSGAVRPRMAAVNAARIPIAGAEGQRVEVQRLHFIRDNHHVANDVTVYGDQKRIQVVLEFHSNAATRDLHPYWDLTDPDNDLEQYADDHGNVGGGGWKDSQAQADFTARFAAWSHENYHVFRSFAWNEDGAMSGVIRDDEGLPILPDLSAFGMPGSSNHIRRPRPIGPSFTYTSNSTRAQVYPARVELGIQGDDDAWIRIPCARIWPERSAFTIQHPQIHLWRPYHNAAAPLKATYGQYTYLTLLNNALRTSGARLRLRLVGSIECDQAVVGYADRRSHSSWPFNAEKTVRAPDRFKWHSVLNNPLGGAATAATDHASTLAAIQEYACRVRDAAEDSLGHGSIVLRYLANPRRYCPGLGVPGTADRAVSLEVSAGTETNYAPVIVGVCWNFTEGVNKTELILDSPLLGVTQ